MKKSEALRALGLQNGATDDEVKKAHRKLVIEHHPDKYPLDSPEHARAEELTKEINEARDVLLNRSWTPEFDPRRDPRPYAGNPYARPGGSAGSPAGGDPFAGWPFAPGRTTYVWTSWDGVHASSTPPASGQAVGGRGPGGPSDPFGGYPFAGADPFDPFAAFRVVRPAKTPEQLRAEAARTLKLECAVIAAKLAAVALLAALGSLASGLFLYVMASVLWGLWKRFGGCLLYAAVPLALLGAPLIFLIAPRDGMLTGALLLAFCFAALFDYSNVSRTYGQWRQAGGSFAGGGKG
ncbi:J domain-containing protein [Adlercreutzia aquisgranensis]|nr:J domain-containing protein [Adlercreutzia aquisgranensis]